MSHRRITSLATTVLLTACLTALATTRPATADPGSFTQPAPVTVSFESHHHVWNATEADVIPDADGETSALRLTSADEHAVVTWIEVAVTIDHPHLDDVDLVLVAPDGRAITLASDVGGNAGGPHTLNFLSAAAPFQDDAFSGSAVTGSPVDYDTPEDRDAHPGNPPATMRALGGTPVNGPGDGVWTLHAYDDTTTNVGRVDSWSLKVYFGAPGSPSPSTLAVGGLPGHVTDVNLVLTEVASDTLRELELLLESPDGRYAHVLSDVDGGWVQGLDLTLDDEAAADISQDASPRSGTYRPRNYDDEDQSEFFGGVDTMDLDARLSTFDGGLANGTWKLWVFQEYCCATTSIGSWGLQVTAEDPAVPPAAPDATVAADTAAPLLSDVRLQPKRLPTGVGARLKVTSSEAAHLVGRVQRENDGRWRHVGTKQWSLQAGANTRLFYGKTAQGRLRSGRYRVLLMATDAAGHHSTEVSRPFSVDRG